MCVLVNNNFCGKLVSSLELPITFDESFTVASVLILIHCVVNYTISRLKSYIESFRIDII